MYNTVFFHVISVVIFFAGMGTREWSLKEAALKGIL